MKKIFLLSAILSFALIIKHSDAQVPDNTDGRLYRLCKVWGYFKYFSQHKCELKWDTLLNTTVNEVLLAGSNDEFNGAMMNMFNKVGTNVQLSNLYQEPDTNLNFDNSWINDPLFSPQVREYLTGFTGHIYPDTSQCLVKFNDFAAPGYTSFIDFRNDPLSMGINFADEANRLTVMFYYWNVINYFSPYRSLMDQNWDSTLYRFIPRIRQAATSLAFNVKFLELVTMINDSHGFTSSALLTYQFWGGYNMPKIFFTRVDSQCVVTKVANIPGVSPGDILTAVKGIPIGEIEDSLSHFIPASTPAAFYRDLYQHMLQGSYSNTIALTLVDSNNNTYTVSPVRHTNVSDWYTWSSDPGLTSSYFITTCGYGYVNMGMLQSSEVPAMYQALKNAPAIIFDLRNYPNGTLWDIGPLLFQQPFPSAVYQQPALVYPFSPPFTNYYLPGWYYVDTDLYNLGNWYNPNSYSGNVYILVNQETQSQAEYTCQYFSYHPNAKVIGTQTAGADGNVSYLTLPGDILTYFTSLGWYYADGYQQQRNGVKIDTIVPRTIEGIRHAKDEVLLAALDCITGIGLPVRPVTGLKVYPNPVTDHTLHLDLNLEKQVLTTVSLINLTGKIIQQQVMEGKEGNNSFLYKIIDCTPGIYLLKVESAGRLWTEKIAIY